jgi:Ca2+-binding RTX toxin-like protein
MPTAVVHQSVSSNPVLNGILWDGWRWDFGVGPKAFTYFLSSDGGIAWNATERAAYVSALSGWLDVVDLDITAAISRESATWVENVATGDQMVFMAGSSAVFAFHDTPEQANAATSQLIDLDHTAQFAAGQVGGFYNRQSLGQFDGWTNAQLMDAGFFQMVMMHELGHGLGLKHTHEAYGAAPTFPGVANGRSLQLGTNQQNHQFWTIMSYNSDYGFDVNGRIVLRINNPSASSLEYGYAKGPMAYDIAAVQFLYGAKTTTASGDTIYDLPDANVAGTGWTCIWDTGGTDMLRYSGTKNTILDLTAATLDGATTGGGVLSYAAFVSGGFTIANGVVIENAMGGSGNDIITGNHANNTLFGGDGNDTLFGAAGNDVLFGMGGNDELQGGAALAGYNQLWGGADTDTVSYANTAAIVYADISLCE